MSPFTFHLIPHTHWDREWYLAHGAFHARLIAVIDDLLARLQAEPEFRSFLLDGQTVLIEDYLRVRPDRELDIQKLVRAGRIQLGPWYVLADELIPSGEALVRNLLLGARDAERFGGRSEVLYSPDAFGHPSIWPTLGRGFGLDCGALWRGRGGRPGEDRDLFRWRAPDGSELLVYHLPPQGYEVGSGLVAEPRYLAHTWLELRASLEERATSSHVAVPIGADQHAAHPAIVRLAALLEKLDPKDRFKISRLDEFLRAASAAGASAPLVEGELRWSYGYTWTLQGIHSTRAPLKRRNDDLELLLERLAEPLAALALWNGGRDRRPLLEHAWRALVQCHFHDSIGGCSSDLVAQALETRFNDVAALGAEIARASLHELVGHDPDLARDETQRAAPQLVLFNPAARARAGVVIADLTFFRRDVLVGPPSGGIPRRREGNVRLGLRDPRGKLIPVQVLHRWSALERLDAARHFPDQDEVDVVRVAFQAPEVPGLAQARLSWSGEESPLAKGGAEHAVVRGRRIANSLVEAIIEPSGHLTLRDRRTGEVLSGLLALESGADIGDTYTYCPPARDRVVQNAAFTAVREVASGPLVAGLECSWRLPLSPDGGDVSGRLLVAIHARSPAVRCALEFANRAVDHRFRARFPVRLTGQAALAGGQFGALRRSPVIVNPSQCSMETPVSTAPAHRFVAAARNDRGLALLLPGFFEYEWTPQGELLLTLLRAVGQLSRDDLATRPGHAGWPTATPMAQCRGLHRVEFALVPVTQAEVDSEDWLPRVWENVYLPVRPIWVRDCVSLPASAGDPARGIELEGDGLIFSALKPTIQGPGLILRCYNATSREVSGTWRFDQPLARAERVRLDEQEPRRLALEDRGKTVRFVAQPREIVTILVQSSS